MLDDRAVAVPDRGLALLAILRVGERMLIGALGDAHALTAHPEPGVVHHGEHGAHALVRLAHEPAGGAVILHHAGGAAMQAHLVLEADTETPLRAPGLPASSGRNLGTRNRLIPFVPGAASGRRASTRWQTLP